MGSIATADLSTRTSALLTWLPWSDARWLHDDQHRQVGHDRSGRRLRPARPRRVRLTPPCPYRPARQRRVHPDRPWVDEWHVDPPAGRLVPDEGGAGHDPTAENRRHGSGGPDRDP